MSNEEKGRKLFIYEGCTSIGIFSLTSGAYLAGFGTLMGIDIKHLGLISSLPTLAGIVQLISPMVFEKIKDRKRVISIMSLIHRLLLVSYVFIPLITEDIKIRTILLALIYGISHIIGLFILPAFSKWQVDLVPQHMRGNYFARKDAVSLLFNIIVTLILGKVLDMFKFKGEEYKGFLFIGFVILILALADFLLVKSTYEAPSETKEEKIKFKDTLWLPFKDKNFSKVMILVIFWNLAVQMGLSFFSIYQVNNLKLDYTYLMIIGFIQNLSRMLFSKYWGRLADNKSWAFTTRLSILTLGITHFSWLFLNNSNCFILQPVQAILSGIGWGGIAISIFNLQFIMAPKENTTVYIGTASAFGGLFGFFSSFLGTKIVGLLEGYNLNLWRFSFSNIQIIFALNGLLLLICYMYARSAIKNTKGIEAS